MNQNELKSLIYWLGLIGITTFNEAMGFKKSYELSTNKEFLNTANEVAVLSIKK